MSHKSFFLQLGILTVLLSIVLFGLHQTASFEPYSSLSWISVLFFCGFNIFLFFVGRNLAISKDKYAFSRLALASMMIKMFLAVFILLIYDKLMEPTTKYFVLTFILIYIPYTIFETYFMMQLSKEKPF